MGLSPDPGDPTDDTAPPTDQQQAGQQQQPSFDQVPPEFRKELQAVRREAAASRVKNKELTAQLQGLDPDGTGRVSLSGVHQELRQLKVDNMVLSTAHKQGVSDLRRLRFELSESDALKSIDPSDAHALEDVDSLIGELCDQVPELKSGGRQSFPPQGTGAQFRPGPTSTQITRSELAGMSASEIDEARRAGRLNALLGRS